MPSSLAVTMRVPSGENAALLAALGQRMPFWDRDIDLLVVARDDTRTLNGLLAVVDRYRVGQIVSVEIGESSAGHAWRDAIAAKSIEVVGAGTGVGIEEGVSLSLAANGWARISPRSSSE